MVRRLVGAGILVVALAGCGEGITENGQVIGAGDVDDVTEDPDAAAAFLAETVEATRAAETGRLEMTMEADDPALPAITMTGEFADAGRSVRMTMDLGFGGDETEITVVDGSVYVDVLGQCVENPLGEAQQGLLEAEPLAPTELLDLLGGVDGGVVEEGTVDVRGVETTHYSGSFTLRESLAAMDDDQREAFESMAGSADLPDEVLDAEFPVDLFLDDEGLVRRQEMELDYPSAVDGLDVPAVSMTMELFDFDADITIEAPTDCDDELPSFDEPFAPDLEEFCDDAFDDLPPGIEDDFPEGFDPCAELSPDEPLGS